MPESNITHSDLAVAIRDRADNGTVEFGVVVNDAFLPIGGMSRVAYDDALAQAAAEKAAEPQHTTTPATAENTVTES